MGSRNRAIAGETNPILSTFAIGFQNPRFIGNLVCPPVPVLKEAGTYFVLGKEGFYLYDTERALRAQAKRIDFFPSKAKFLCAEHALETALDYKEIDIAEKFGANQVLKLKKRVLSIAENALATDKEKTIADILFSGTYYAVGNKKALTLTECWSEAATSTPINDIRTGKKAARADMGIEPNTLVLGYASYDLLRNHPTVTSKIRNSKNTFVTGDDLKEILDFANVIVGSSVYSTDAGVFTDLWTDNVALIYLPGKGEIVEGVPVHTVQFNELGYPQVKEYLMKKTIDIEETHKFQIKNISTSYGYLITNTQK